MLYDINSVFSININKLSDIYLFLTLLLVKLFFTGHGVAKLFASLYSSLFAPSGLIPDTVFAMPFP